MLILLSIILAVVLIIVALMVLFFVGASWLDREEDIEVFEEINKEIKDE